MKLLEYEGRNLFEKYSIPVKKGKVIERTEELYKVAYELNFPLVIKAQLPVGGRGKAGGIQIAHNLASAKKHTDKILGMEIKGYRVKKVLIVEAIDIKKEFYLSLSLDRNKASILLMGLKQGGVEVEEVAKKSPESIYIDWINPLIGLQPYQVRKISYWFFGQNKELAQQLENILKNLLRLFIECNALLLEINPLSLDEKGFLWATDSKIILDDNAQFKFHRIIGERDTTYENEKELEAKSADLSYVQLDGFIGCCVNGAGLAMATMDIIKRYGGEPANFLDIGGSSSPEKVKKAMEILLSDKNVKVVFFNIFGGITRCDDVAKGMVKAFKEIKTPIPPVVVRITGTNENSAREILNELSVHTVSSMAEGAKKALALAGK